MSFYVPFHITVAKAIASGTLSIFDFGILHSRSALYFPDKTNHQSQNSSRTRHWFKFDIHTAHNIYQTHNNVKQNDLTQVIIAGSKSSCISFMSFSERITSPARAFSSILLGFRIPQRTCDFSYRETTQESIS